MPVPHPWTPRAPRQAGACPGAWVLLVAAYLLTLPGTAAHAQSSAATPNGAPATATPAPAPVVRSYLPKPTESLDQVIAHTLPDSPLKIDLLRQAFVAQNPQAFAPGKLPKLRKGVALRVPDHDELLRIHLGSRVAPVEAPPPNARFVPSTSEERKRWVQFP